jgi:thiol-disulfide isomerase/thioredoxin
LEKRTSDRWVLPVVTLVCAGALVTVVVQGRRAARVDEERPAPKVSLPLLGGKGGKAPLPSDRVTIVDFWATWCAPCRASMPRVQKVIDEYGPKGVALYSVDTDDPGPQREAEVREFLAENKLSFPVVLDDSSATEAFRIENLPTMVLLDRRGRVVWQHVGALNEARERDLRAQLDQALAQP